ncbi:MAG: tetratricopeptide repeat protein [Candidatus Binatia bacterium]
MKTVIILFAIFLVVTISACASYRIAGQVQAGRQALLINEPERAVAYLQEAADSNPDYIRESELFRESVWTYLGRAQYALGKWPDARRSFERALSVYRDDYLAHLYLGLTLARNGDQSQGVRELETGLKGLYDWMEYMNYSRPLTAYWDPLRQIRTEIEKDLAMISGKDIDREKLIASAEWVGKEMEEEVDRVRRDEYNRFRRRDNDLRRGGSIGAGIGV